MNSIEPIRTQSSILGQGVSIDRNRNGDRKKKKKNKKKKKTTKTEKKRWRERESEREKWEETHPKSQTIGIYLMNIARRHQINAFSIVCRMYTLHVAIEMRYSDICGF